MHYFPPQLRRAVTFPWRLARQRVSVQLIYSQVLVVLLTILLIEAIAFSLALTLVTTGVVGEAPVDAIDLMLVERTQVAGVLLTSDPVRTKLAEGATTLTDLEREHLGARLRQLVNWPAPPDSGVDPDAMPPLPHNIAYALVVDVHGTIAVSTDPTLAPPGQPVESIGDALVTRVTRNAIQSSARYDQTYQPFAEVSERRTVAAFPILDEERVVGAVMLHGVQWEHTQGIRNLVPLSALPRFALTNGIVLTLVSIPALLVSIPVGVWRARRISRRLADLAAAADAMAAGDLQRRVEVTGEDEISRVSQRFNDMIDRLQEADRARKAFVSNVSHELRTPVAVIQGNAERMLDGRSIDVVDAQRTLELVYQETVTLSRLIEDLFTLARIEEAVLPLEARPVSIHDVARQAVESLRTVAWGQRKVSVRSIVPAELPLALADRTRVRQILNNLLYNALRHTPEGGLIVIDATRHGNMIEVSVSDTGVGIPADELERVFERFHQVEQGRRHGDGSGLGLAIVKQLVEAQHGAVSVESVLGRGTIFRLSLPIAP